jgi:hypothetical protein
MVQAHVRVLTQIGAMRTIRGTRRTIEVDEDRRRP